MPICKYCGREFKPTKKHPYAKYCHTFKKSNRFYCYQKAWRERNPEYSKKYKRAVYIIRLRLSKWEKGIKLIFK